MKNVEKISFLSKNFYISKDVIYIFPEILIIPIHKAILHSTFGFEVHWFVFHSYFAWLVRLKKNE